MKPKETINLYRVISLLVIALVTFGVMGGLGAKSHLYPAQYVFPDPDFSSGMHV